MLMNVSEVSSSSGTGAIRVRVDRLCVLFTGTLMLLTHKRRRPFHAPFSPHGTCHACKRGTKHITGLFLNNNTLLFPWTTAQMIINSSLPGHRVGKWWSLCLEWCSHKALLFNTCQHAIVSTIRIKVYRVIHIKCLCREATITFNERQGSDNCFFYHSDSRTRFTYGTRFFPIVVAVGLWDLHNKTTAKEPKILLQSTVAGKLYWETSLSIKQSFLCLQGMFYV